jgi:hypothetical protein
MLTGSGTKGRLARLKDMALREFRLIALLALTIPLGLGLMPHPASATTVERKSLSDLAKGSELIIDGTVTGRSVEALANGQGARTCFTFKITEVIVGSHPGKTLRLCFFGGEINGRGFAVSGMRYPNVGERGIYLIESTHQAMLNPLIGWDQGRFLIVKDATGGAKVTTADGQRITGLADTAARPTSADEGIVSPSGAAAAGVVSDQKPELAGAMSRDEFVAKLRSYRDQ